MGGSSNSFFFWSVATAAASSLYPSVVIWCLMLTYFVYHFILTDFLFVFLLFCGWMRMVLTETPNKQKTETTSTKTENNSSRTMCRAVARVYACLVNLVSRCNCDDKTYDNVDGFLLDHTNWNSDAIYYVTWVLYVFLCCSCTTLWSIA